MKILLAGGGSGGPVMPVLAVEAQIKKLNPEAQFLFVGTVQGPEKSMVSEAGIDFVSIVATKLHRYFTLRNLFIPFTGTASFQQARKIVRQFNPDAVFSAGGYVAVPVCWAAKMMGAKIFIHQQDAQVGLANKLIAPFAQQITTAFEQTSEEINSSSGIFKKKWQSATWVGNPIREDLFDSPVDAKAFFNLHESLPILLILGGATGAAQINQMIAELLPDLLTAHQVVHQTGIGKNTIEISHHNYHPYELLPFDAYASILKQAHLIIARAGLSTIAELSALGKPAIVIPMPGTHQEANAKILEEAHAAVVLKGLGVNAESLSRVITSLKFNQKRVESLEKNIANIMPHNAAEKIAHLILKS